MIENEAVADAPDADPPKPAKANFAALSPEATCREIERTLAREPGDSLKCAHLFGSYYRCNWWARSTLKPPIGQHDWLAQLDDHVRKSSFLKVTMTNGHLAAVEVPSHLCRT